MPAIPALGKAEMGGSQVQGHQSYITRPLKKRKKRIEFRYLHNISC
jgi:hypothetical protein